MRYVWVNENAAAWEGKDATEAQDSAVMTRAGKLLAVSILRACSLVLPIEDGPVLQLAIIDVKVGSC